MEKKTFTRHQLYELVWEKPVREIAADIGISDVGLAKACRRLRIPLPGRGYWAKVAAGHKLSRIPLTSSPNTPSEVSFAPVERKEASEVATKIEAVAQTLPSIELSTLSSPHPLTKAVRAAFRKQRPDRQGLISAAPVSGLAVSVFPSTTERALVIVDTLLVALLRRGLKVREARKDRWQTEPDRILEIEGEPVQMRLREGFRRKQRSEDEIASERARGDHYPDRFIYSATGKLVFSLENAPYGMTAQWKDGRQRIEERLDEILAAILSLPNELKEARRKKEEYEQQRREEETKRWKAQQIRETRQKRLDELVEESRAYRIHNELLDYLSQLEIRAKQSGKGLTAQFKQGLVEARHLAKQLDPTESRIETLGEHGLVSQSELYRLRW
jgi:hypothetical protein